MKLIKNEGQSFWTDKMKMNMKASQEKLQKSPTHPLLQDLYRYDMLSFDIVQKWKVGIMEVGNKEWICLPYKTGVQLYRRENGEKVIRCIKGSKPTNSFFELLEDEPKEMLIIAKSPREVMLLDKLIGDKAKIIGLVSGEIGTLSKNQEQYLREALKGINSVYVLLDSDNLNSKSTSMNLSTNISKICSQPVFRADVSTHSNEKYKDITDAIRAGNDSGYVMDLLASAENINNIRNITLSPNSVINQPGRLPDSVYDFMPVKLKEMFGFVDRVENRDILLMASLPVIASHMDNVFARYGVEKLSPDLYCMIVASAAAGKGYANQARQLGLQLSDYITEENQNRLDLLNAQNKADQPKHKSLFLPANSSSRAIYDLLGENEGKGLIFETEIDTMLSAIAQDWGNFSDLTRKSFHHEECSLSRKGEMFTIKNPRLSMFMSGTHDQFKEMFRNTENGLYSRFAFYTFESKPEWISQRPSKSVDQLHIHISEMSRWLYEINRSLNERSEPLEVTLADHCWRQMDDYFEIKIEEFNEEQHPEELIANIKRSGIILTRITMLFSLIRAYQELGSDGLFSKKSITAEDVDFENALTIVDTLIDHSFYLYGLLGGGNEIVFKNQRMEQFYNDLPLEFNKKEALKVGDEMDLPSASVSRYLQKFEKNGNLSRPKHGEYKKAG